MVFFILFISGIFITYFLERPNVNEAIDQSIQEQENSDIFNEENLPIEDDHHKKEESLPEQVKDGIVESVIQVVDFFFQREFSIVAIGDSLTKGVGDTTKQGGYVGILDRSINQEKQIVTFSNFGKTGNRTDQLLKRLEEPEIIEAIEEAEIILITIGANDIMQVAKENFTHLTYDLFMEEKYLFAERLQEIFANIHEKNPKAHLYLMGVYNPFREYFGEIEELDQIVNEWNHTSQKVTESFSFATFIPIKDLFEASTEHLLSEDQFHPNEIGYRLIAERVLEFLTMKEKG